MADEQDRSDVASVLAGDTRAFEGIVRRWQGPLVNLAYRMCRDRGRAEEMAQEAFLKAYRGLRRFEGEARFSTWLFAVALNAYRSHLRRLAPVLVSLDEGSIADVAEAAGEHPDAWKRDEEIRQAVARLPARYRDSVVLFYFEERDLAETARVLGVPEGTVKARLHRARELLRRRLASWAALEAVEPGR